MSDTPFTVTGRNYNDLDKVGVARTIVTYHRTIRHAQVQATKLEGVGYTVAITEPKIFKPALDLEVGDVFLDEDGQSWTVEENLPSINKRGSNVTVTSTDRGARQRGSFSFNGPHQVELVVSK